MADGPIDYDGAMRLELKRLREMTRKNPTAWLVLPHNVGTPYSTTIVPSERVQELATIIPLGPLSLEDKERMEKATRVAEAKLEGKE